MSTTTTPDLQTQAAVVVAGVRAAARPWADLSVRDRAERLRAAGRHVLERADELAGLIGSETHKPLAESYSSEVLGVADLFSYWCRHAPQLLAPRRGHVPSLEMPGKKAWVERVPHGVVALIAPWNYPIALPMRTIVPALIAGNGVVLKPSEHTPRTGEWLVARLREVLGGVIDVLPGAGDAGQALVAAGPDLVAFVGSTRTGRKVAIACAERGIRCELELGGKDCAVVLPDADLERTAAGIAWGILTNAGQNCAGIERVAVTASIAPAFVPALVRHLERAAADVPELVTATQRAVVVRHIEDAIAQGGRVLCGGVTPDRACVPPTLLGAVPRTALAWREETFGPVAVLEVCDDAEACVVAANDSRYGLGASVWGHDTAAALAVARRLSCGMVWVNNHGFTGALPDLPWAGTGDSGSGVTGSPEALLHLTRPRLVLIDKAKALEPWWYPYGQAMVDLMRTLVARQQAGGVGATLRTLKALKARNREMDGRASR